MARTDERPAAQAAPRRLLALTFGVLGGPVSWFLTFQLNYMATPYLCSSRWSALMFVVAGGALLVTALALWVAWKEWTRLREEPPHPSGHTHERRQTMAVAGLGMSSFFLVVIVAQNLPLFFLEPCR